MSVTITSSPNTVTAYLSGEIDHHTAGLIRADIDERIKRQIPKNIILDFSGVTFTDSSGIGLVLGRYKLMSEIGGQVSVTGLDGKIYKVMCLAGLDKLVDLKKEGGKTMKSINTMRLILESRSVNESFARAAVSAFAAQLDPTVEEISDIKTAVSEAVTNSIVHGYRDRAGKIYITCDIFENGLFRTKIRDCGCGIEDVKKAMEPLYTTLGEERAGLGFAVMESFTDKLKVRSAVGRGTTVTLEKIIAGRMINE